MKKRSKFVLAILLVVSMVLSPMATVFADTNAAVVSNETETSKGNLKDGTYEVKDWSFVRTNGTSRRNFTMKDTLEVRGGVAYVTLTVDSTTYTLVRVNGTEYAVTVGDTTSTFEVPAELGKEVTVAMYSSSMETWMDYTLVVNANVPVNEVVPAVKWQDGFYTATAKVEKGDYLKADYEVDVTVEIKDGKIAKVEYTDEIATDNGNISYMIWAMDGCHIYKDGKCEYLTGMETKMVKANSPEVDVVSGATRISNGIKGAVKEALVKAETGDKDAERQPVEKPVVGTKIVDEGRYTVEAKANGVTVIDAELKSKDGKMTALITLSGTGYTHLYFGSDDEAHDAGEDAWYGVVGTKQYVNAKGQTKTGAQYEFPVESLDKEIKFVSLAKSTGKWFFRTITFDSASLEPVHPFVDVPVDAYYEAPVIWAMENNITTGITETEFRPEEACTRGQIVTFLWRAAGKPEPTEISHPFVDVPVDAYYEAPVIWAMENNITTGITETEFRPEEACTRGQIVTFLWRAAGKPEPTEISHPFVDVPAGTYYEKAVIWAVENGITTGITETEFRPEEACTRGQIVTFLYRSFVK